MTWSTASKVFSGVSKGSTIWQMPVGGKGVGLRTRGVRSICHPGINKPRERGREPACCDSDQVRAARRWFGAMPLIVLTASPIGPRADENQLSRPS